MKLPGEASLPHPPSPEQPSSCLRLSVPAPGAMPWPSVAAAASACDSGNIIITSRQHTILCHPAPQDPHPPSRRTVTLACQTLWQTLTISAGFGCTSSSISTGSSSSSQHGKIHLHICILMPDS